jgi:hypothetical protein
MPRTEGEVDDEIALLLDRVRALELEKREIRADAGLPQTGRPEIPIEERDAKQHKNKKNTMLSQLRKGANFLTLGARRNFALYLRQEFSDGESVKRFRKRFVEAYNKGEDKTLTPEDWEEALLAILPKEGFQNPPLGAGVVDEGAPGGAGQEFDE